MNEHFSRRPYGFWRSIAIPLGLVVASVALTSVFFLLPKEHTAETGQRVPLARSGTAPALKGQIRLYFASRESEGLVEELREVEVQDRLLDQMTQTVLELTKGPQTNALPVIPEGVRVHAVYLDEDGVAYVDLGSELIGNHPGGMCAEVITVYAIVDSLTANYPKVAAVQVLVDGAEIETLAGHLDMRNPILPDFSLVIRE